MRRVPVRLQASAVECGAACLAMVLGHHGCHTRVSDLRDAMMIGRDGATAGAIARQARQSGLAVRAFRAEPDTLAGLALPLIVHWTMSHFVVVERFRKAGVDIVDPSSGRRNVTAAEFDRCFTGIVLELVPTPELETRPDPGPALIRFVRPFLPRSPGVLSAVLVASALLTLLGLVPALVVRYVVDDVVPGRQISVLAALGLGLIAFAVGHGLTAMARAEFLLWLQTRIDWSLMSAFLRRLMALPYAFFQLRRGGDLLFRVSSTAYVRDVVSSQMLAVLVDAALLVSYLAVIGVQSVMHLAAVVVIAGLQVVVMVVSLGPAQRLTERELQATGEAQSSLMETVNGVESIKTSGAEDVAVDRWSTAFRGQLAASVRRRRLDNATDSVRGALTAAAPVAMLLLGVHLVLGGRLSLGGMLALNTLAAAALTPIGQLGQSLKSLQIVRVHLDRLRDVFDETPESGSRGGRTLTLEGRIGLDQVSFRYAREAPDVVHAVDLQIAPGEKIAIVGRSGSGKSTLARLMLGLYEPTGGSIRFDSTALQELDLRSLRSQCGVVTQNADIFSGSILTNIALVTPHSTLEDVAAAARLAAIHDDVLAMPMGYETVLGDGGAGLSGGQRQRIALARALVARPRVLLLDEATSHLDAVTEAQVHHNLTTLCCTRIVIAHRLSTVRDADRILVMRDGRVTESGRHDDLLDRDGDYKRLVSEQLVG